MALRINTNVAALNSHKNMVSTDNSLSSSLERLSSGLRINKAADDASGMSIADSLKSQALGLGQAIRNGNDGINIVQTADAALQESINIVNSIKTKSIQSAQDGQTTDSRSAIQADIDKLMEELDMIANTTAFNNQKLLSGNFTNKKFQMGAYSGETLGVSIGSAQSQKIGHMTSSTLSMTDNAPGTVQLSLYSNINNANFQVQSADVLFNNKAENSMGALANNINKFSDQLGISATANVGSTTEGAVNAGTTDSDFAVNGTTIGQFNVQDNDENGALVKAINQKTKNHGVVASTNSAGFLNLSSSDGRAIDVTATSITEGSNSGINAILGGTDMSTLGTITLQQNGSNEIIVNDIGGGAAVSLTTDLEIDGDTTTTISSVAAEGSVLKSGSKFQAGWTTGEALLGSNFTTDLTTSISSTLKEGSVLGATSNLGEGTVIQGQAVTSGVDVTGTSSEYTLAAGSQLTKSSVLASGTVLGANLRTSGGTITLSGDSLLKAGSTLISGSSIASGTIIGGELTLSGNLA
ncbi:MAG: flagellar protein FlaB, partial [Desulfobacteraceae bacterium]|nr:flagellar protein FlaB [Desulfobacteraceae bacterium]